MDYQQKESVFPVPGQGTVAGQGVARTFMASVFMWMFVALGISAVAAVAFSSVPELNDMLRNDLGGMTLLGKVVMFAPLLFVLVMSLGFARLSAPLLVVLYIAYAAITGISFSFIFQFYQLGSVMTCFAASAAMFGVMAVMGYTTNKDLTSFGRIMIMGLIGIVVASLINMFLGSERMDYIISIIGVAVFTGLTAYDVQKIKRVGQGIEYEGADATQVRKLSILGGLTLYLDFINLFLMLLRVFGSRR